MTPAELRRIAEDATPVKGFPGYEITREGKLFSVHHNWRGYGAREITPQEDVYGYLSVRMSVGGERKKRKVHRLVADAFLPSRPEGAQVRHLDGNKLNNFAENLAWGSARDNAKDRDRHGTTARGVRNGFSKIDESIVRRIRKLRDSGLLYREIESITGVSRYHARQIVAGVIWSHVA